MRVPDLPAHGRAWRALRGLVTLRSMVSAVRAELPEGDPAIVVAHSRGGIVASALAEAEPERVRASVYLAAFMLRSGERVVDHFRSDKASLVAPNVVVDRVAMTDMLLERAFREALYADCSEDDVELATRLLTPEPLLPALTRLSITDARYGRVPRHYVELTEDRAVTPDLQRRLYFAQECVSVTRLDASHSAYFSRPDELAGVLERIASR